jgi:hypothetical protein
VRASHETVDEEVEEQLEGLVPVLCGELIRDRPQVRVPVGGSDSIMTLRAQLARGSLFSVIVVVICVVTWRVFKTGRPRMR